MSNDLDRRGFLYLLGIGGASTIAGCAAGQLHFAVSCTPNPDGKGTTCFAGLKGTFEEMELQPGYARKKRAYDEMRRRREAQESAPEFREIERRRGQMAGHRLPTVEELNQKNLVDFLLDAEYEYSVSKGEDHPCVPTKNPGLKGCDMKADDAYHKRLEEAIALDNGYRSQARNVFESIVSDFRSPMRGRRTAGLSAGDAKGLLTIMHKLMVKHGLKTTGRGAYGTLTGDIRSGEIHTDTYALVAVGIAERYGLPLHGMLLPDHQAARWKEPALNFDQGLFIPDEEYISHYDSRRMRDVKPGVYLAPLSKQELAGSHLASMAERLSNGGKFNAGAELATRAALWTPRDPRTHIILAKALMPLAYFTTAREEYQAARGLDPSYSRYDIDLGLLATLEADAREKGIDTVWGRADRPGTAF